MTKIRAFPWRPKSLGRSFPLTFLCRRPLSIVWRRRIWEGGSTRRGKCCIQYTSRSAEGIYELFRSYSGSLDGATTADTCSCERRVQNLNARRRCECDFPGGPVSVPGKNNLYLIAHLDTSSSTADTDGGHWCFKYHGIRINFGYLTRYKRHDTTDQGNTHLAGLFARVVNHFIHYGAAVIIQRKYAVISQQYPDSTLGPSFQHIALENRNAFITGSFGAIGSGDRHCSFNGFYTPDRFRSTGRRSLGKLPWRQWSG